MWKIKWIEFLLFKMENSLEIMIHFVYLVQIFSIKIKGGSACKNNLCSAYTYVFSQSPFFLKSENSIVIKSWSPYVTLLNYFATFPLIWFLNSSQQTLLNLELLLSNRDRHSKKANVWRGNERGRQISPGIWTASKHDLDSL